MFLLIEFSSGESTFDGGMSSWVLALSDELIVLRFTFWVKESNSLDESNFFSELSSDCDLLSSGSESLTEVSNLLSETEIASARELETWEDNDVVSLEDLQLESSRLEKIMMSFH